MIDRLLRHALRAMWLVVIPALGASVCLRYAIFSPADAFAAGAPPSELFLREHWLAVWGLAFVALAWVVRHWAPVLPGGHALTPEGEAARGHGKSGARSTLVAVAVALAAALFIRENAAGIYRVEGASMLPSLEAGDHVLVHKLAYGARAARTTAFARMPRRGDRILLRRSVDGVERELVKRVIALPGERVRMAGAHPVINGWSVPRCDLGPYTYLEGDVKLVGRASVEFLGDTEYVVASSVTPSAESVEFVVGEGELFVLGDNRSASKDSRSWGGERGGAVPLPAVEGRVEKTLVGVDRLGQPDFRQLLLPPSDFNLHGFDVRPLESALQRCRAKRPKVTSPEGSSPPREASAQAAMRLTSPIEEAH